MNFKSKIREVVSDSLNYEYTKKLMDIISDETIVRLRCIKKLEEIER